MITNIKIIQWYIKLLGGFLSSAKLKRRYFRLDDDFLLHYYKEDNGSAQGNIDLSTAFKVELTNEPEKGPKPGDPYIAIHTPSRKWVLSGPLDLLIKWTATLKFCTKANTQEKAEATHRKKAAERKKNRGSMMQMMVSFSRFNTGGGAGATVQPPGTVPAKQYSLTFEAGPLYLDLIADDEDNIKVSGFAETPDGKPGPAEESGKIVDGDYLLACNETSFEDLGFYESIDVIKAASYPKEFLFEHPPVEPQPDLEGWLGKKGEHNNTFRRRYFKLYGSSVFYYKPTMVDIETPSTTATGSLDLTTVNKVTPVENDNFANVNFKNFTVELETNRRNWVFGFKNDELMNLWCKKLAEVTGKDGALQELKKIEKSKSGGTGAGNENHNTFMLKFIVPAEAPTGAQLEVTDPYDRKIRVTVPDDLPEDRVMLVPIEAPSIDNQEKLLNGSCSRKCWFDLTYRQRFYDIYADRIVLKRQEADEDGTPLFFGELNAICKKFTLNEDAEAGGEFRLAFTNSNKDYFEIGFTNKDEMENAFVTMEKVLTQKFANCTFPTGITEPQYSKFAATEEQDEVDDVKSGWIWKKGQGTFLGATRNAYRRRWFALRHNELMYFKYQKANKGFGTGTHDTAGRAGVIDMAQVESVEICTDDGCADNTIVVNALNRKYYLVVPGSDEEFNDWFESLTSAADVYGGEGGTEALEALKKQEAEAEENRVAAIKATFKKTATMKKMENMLAGMMMQSTFQQRFFVLDAESISYYLKEEDVYDADKDPYGSMIRKQIASMEYPSKGKNSKTSFDVTAKNGTNWVIDGGSFDVAKEWISALTKKNGLDMQVDKDTIKTVVTKAQLGNRMDFYGGRKKKKKGKKKKKIGGRGKRMSTKMG